MDHNASAPAAHPRTQVGYTAMTVFVEKRKNDVIIVIECDMHDMKTNLVIFLLQVKNKPHDEVLCVHLFLRLVRS
jgi:hypothetical protein